MMLAARRAIAPIAFVALVLQLTLSLPASAGLVLCVGSDGHTKVESSAASDCGSLAQSPATCCDELDGSSPCTDTAFDACELVSAKSLSGDCGAMPGPAPALTPSGITAASRVCQAALLDLIRTQRSAILRL